MLAGHQGAEAWIGWCWYRASKTVAAHQPWKSPSPSYTNTDAFDIVSRSLFWESSVSGHVLQ